MPKKRDARALLAELEAKRKLIEERIRAKRQALQSREAREQRARRLGHERAMPRVFQRCSVEGVTPEQLAAALASGGLKRRGEVGLDVATATEAPTPARATLNLRRA